MNGVRKQFEEWCRSHAAVSVRGPAAIEYRTAPDATPFAVWIEYTLLSKIGRRWTWSEGKKDDVMAAVPEAQFAAAARLVGERDVP